MIVILGEANDVVLDSVNAMNLASTMVVSDTSIFADLRMFDLAQDYLSDGESANKSQLLKRKAEWAQKINEPRAAAEVQIHKRCSWA